MSPTIRLLGSIEVLSDCRDFHPINLGPGRQRAVLAVLLLAAPQAVAVDDLIDRVWGEDLPVAARGSVRAHICRVRKAVAASGVLEIDRVGVGYRAVFNPDSLDLYQFRVLVGQARTASRTGDLESAYTGLSAALELWTGPALGGADSCWLADQRTGLAFERRDALTQRVDLAIRLGEHAQIVPGLILECCSEPYDERLAGQLMLALSASGRTGESLTVYDRMRRRLREELGTEPGSGLRAIHQQILRSDPSPPSPSPRRVVPHQLPPATSGFIDRVAEHARLDDTLLVAPDQSAQPAVLTGMGGVGKTSLAVQWAHSRRAEFPDGQLFVDLQGFDAERAPLSAESALRGLLLALGADPAALPIELNNLTGMYRTLLARRKVLVVADNARSSAQVRPLLPPSPSVGVVTSRSSLDGLLADPGATLIPVEMLPADEARQLIERRIGRHRVEQEPDSAARLVRHCAGLPLALALVAGQAAATPQLRLDALATQLDSQNSRLDQLGSDDPDCDVRSTVEVSVAALSADAARLFGCLGLCPGPTIGRTAVTAASGLIPGVVDHALRQLSRVHLVQQWSPDRFGMHDLVRLHAAERGLADPEADQIVRRLLRFFVDSARLTDTAGESAEPSADSRFVESEADTLMAALNLAVTHGDDDLVGDIAAALQRHLGVRGCWPELVRVSGEALAAGRRLEDPARVVRAQIGLARGWIGMGEYSRANAALADAVPLLVDSSEPALQASVQRALGRLAAQQHRHTEAVVHDQQALTLFRQLGDIDGEATSVNAIGWHLTHLDRPAAGLVHCRRALTLFERTGNLRGQGMTLDSVAYALDQLGRHGAAQQAYQRAAGLMTSIGAHQASAETLRRLADSYRVSGDLRAAALAAGRADDSMLLNGCVGEVTVG